MVEAYYDQALIDDLQRRGIDTSAITDGQGITVNCETFTRGRDVFLAVTFSREAYIFLRAAATFTYLAPRTSYLVSRNCLTLSVILSLSCLYIWMS